jgi:hypothetical protein
MFITTDINYRRSVIQCTSIPRKATHPHLGTRVYATSYRQPYVFRIRIV